MRRMGSAAALAVALLIGLTGPAAAQEDPAQLLDRGKREFEAGNFVNARADLWAYLEATAGLSGPSRLPQADALYTIALMEADAGIAAQHYRTIVEEYAASSVGDEALFRLAQLDLVEGRTEDAREKLQQLSVDYPFSHHQAEIPLWSGKAWLADRQYRRATDSFIEGFTRVKRQDLPQELSAGQREALGAEYVYQLARAFGEEGDNRTATQYYAMLALDYPDSPQAGEARLALGAEGEPVGDPVQVAVAPTEEPGAEEVVPNEEPVVREEPAAEAPAPREEPPVTPAGGDRPVYVPDEGGLPSGGAAVGEAPDVIIEERAREPEPGEPPPVIIEERAREPEPGEPPPVIIEDARPREEPERDEPPPVIIEEAPPRYEPAPASGSSWLQVGAFTSAANAADLSRRLKGDGFDSQVEIGIVDGQGYYRVRVGPYRLPSDSSRLEETRRRLEAQGYPARQVGE
ncbi:MAG TPA: SPOR domain-containing protein [Gemmatimonadota bacterium]|nr:SPOR domain-containing protein [Gemmatimonadota bacterium]